MCHCLMRSSSTLNCSRCMRSPPPPTPPPHPLLRPPLQSPVLPEQNFMPVDIVQMHEVLFRKYQEKEDGLRVVVEEMKQRADALQAGSNVA